MAKKNKSSRTAAPPFTNADATRRPTDDLERALWQTGVTAIAGVDEVGRGAWAGPVVAAAVILRPDDIPTGLDDSKRLSPAQRDALNAELLTRAAAVAVGVQDAPIIDRINILEATKLAMRAALDHLPIRPDHLLIDALTLPGIPLPQQGIIRGDARSVSIAAASIVAKVFRDRLMGELDLEFPEYGFAAHKGYGTARHRAALARLGPCRVHRLTFRGVLPESPSTNRYPTLLEASRTPT